MELLSLWCKICDEDVSSSHVSSLGFILLSWSTYKVVIHRSSFLRGTIFSGIQPVSDGSTCNFPVSDHGVDPRAPETDVEFPTSSAISNTALASVHPEGPQVLQIFSIPSKFERSYPIQPQRERWIEKMCSNFRRTERRSNPMGWASHSWMMSEGNGEMQSMKCKEAFMDGTRSRKCSFVSNPISVSHL